MTERRDYGISDADLLGRLQWLGREATQDRIEQLGVDGVALGRRRANLRIRQAIEAGIVHMKIEGPYGEPWYAPTPLGRKLAGIVEPVAEAADEPLPSGLRARARTSARNRRESGWEVGRW